MMFKLALEVGVGWGWGWLHFGLGGGGQNAGYLADDIFKLILVKKIVDLAICLIYNAWYDETWWFIYRGYPAKRALYAMHKHGG